MASTSSGKLNDDDGIKVASKVEFNQLCQLLERMQKANNNATRKKEFQKFLTKWNDIHNTVHKNKNTKDSFYPVLRLIVPQLERERPSYGIKETALGKLYVEIFGLSRNSPDAKKILHYKNPKSNNTGDFAEIAYTHVLAKRCPSSGTLTIQQINDHLDSIASHSNQGQKSLLNKTFMTLVQNTSATEQKWLARIILKDTKLKLGYTAILNQFHPDAEDLYNITTSLREICEKLRDQNVRLSDTEVSLFQPFRPMLAEIAKITEVEKLMNNKSFRIEIKYDGERSQLHKDGVQYKYFSRSGREYSTVFGDNPYSGSLTPFIHDYFENNVKSCILDGEMMGYDPDLQTFVQKGAQFDIKHITQDSDLQPCFVAYDILMLNGENLSSLPLAVRLEKLDTVFTTNTGRIQFAENWSCNTNADVVKYLNDAVDRREEGIIVKHPEGHYAPNKRKGSGWIKIKPEYASGVIDDMDLVVVGGKFGSDRYANIITKFLLAVGVDDPNNPDKPPQKFKTFAFVGSGFTNTQLYKIMEILKPNLELFRKKTPPSWLMVSKEKPEVVIEPKNSVVVQIKATEIISSNAYSTGCTLRFPRVIAHRDDKTYESAMNESQLTDLRNMAEGKLTARHASLSTEEPPTKRKRVQRNVVPPTINAKFQSTNASDVSKVSTVLHDKEICILTGNNDCSKKNLETLVIAHGGTIVQNPSKSTHCVIARDTKNVRVKNAMKSNKYNIVKLQWLVRCCESKKLFPFSPLDILQITKEAEKELGDFYDKFGDDFVTPLTNQTLQEILHNIPVKTNVNTDFQAGVNALYEQLEEYEFHDNSCALFNQLNIFVCCNTPGNKELKSLVRFYGGILQDEVKADTSHVIIQSSQQELINELFQKRRNQAKKFHVVSPEWVFESVAKQQLAFERQFAVTLKTIKS